MHERRTPKKVRRGHAVKKAAPATPPARRPGYRKGDDHSGGGGSIGEGGKKRHPPGGWRKSDFLRDVDASHDAVALPIKPGRDEKAKAKQNAAKRARRKARKTP